MKAERLLELYDRISEAPDAVSRLRRFVLDLAVRGKLVEQDPEDEPASELLDRTSAVARKVKAKSTSKRSQPPAPIDHSFTPHSLPPGWHWTCFGDLADFSAGRTPPRKEPAFWGTGDFAWVSIADMTPGGTILKTKDSVSQAAKVRIFKADPEPAGTMLMSFKLTIGKVARLGIPAFHNEAIISIRPYVDDLDPYLFRFLPGFARAGQTKGAIKGATLNRGSLSNILVPLPPLAEQHRIVAKLDELMALCDRLEEEHGTREATRDRLTTATLSRLTAPDTDEQSFQSHARFALDTLPALTARPDQTKAVRQVILDLAVRGRLVEQDPRDEPASELFIRLNEAKEMAFATEKLRKRPPVSESAQELGAVDGPATWVQAKFDDLLVIVSGVTKGQKFSDRESVEANYMRVANVQRGFLDLSVVKTIKVRATDVMRYRLADGDVLMTEGGDWDKLGRAAVWRGQIPDCIHQNHVYRLRSASPELLPEWVVLFANSAVGQSFFAEASKRTTNLASINMTQLRSCPLPLPPTNEQRGIVAKVDELMALCDHLEASLQEADNKRARLLESLLAEALAPAKRARPSDGGTQCHLKVGSKPQPLAKSPFRRPKESAELD